MKAFIVHSYPTYDETYIVLADTLEEAKAEWSLHVEQFEQLYSNGCGSVGDDKWEDDKQGESP